MEHVTIQVKGMSCEHCVQAVEGSVGDLPGVITTKVHLDPGTVDVTFDTQKVTIEEIKKEIEDQGYDL
ncbi:MAG TPA: copper chaperone CopZ [Bacillota bacterium]|nr:copper chaperone CopZ [Bacillota bacterium]